MAHNWTVRLTARKLALGFTVLSLLLLIGIVTAQISTPTWTNPVGSSGPATCLNFQTVGAEAQVRFGDDDLNGADCPADPNTQTGLGVEGSNNAGHVFASGVPFVIGELTHYNNSVFATSLLQSIDLNMNINFVDPAYTGDFTTTLTIDETANLLNTCPYGDTQPCADRISINRISQTFSIGADDYEFEILGLIPGSMGSCTYDESQISTNFVSDENAANSACIFGRLVLDEDAQVLITKDTDPAGVTVVSPGDILDFKIDYECSSITSSCRNVQLFDFLPDEFVFVGSTGSIHFDQGVYSEDNNSVLWDLRANLSGILSAGSTGFVRVRVRVRDDGVIPNNQPMDNVIISTLDNGPTTTDNYVVTNTAVSNWVVQKQTLTSVYLDTSPPQSDVVYEVRICSAGSSVNLLNAQMVDTVPVGAVIVDADGGTIGGGSPQTITWDLGDLSANSNCETRRITLQYPEPTFTDGQNVTNTVVGTGNPVGEPPWTDTADVTDPLERFQPLPSATIGKNAIENEYVIGATAGYILSASNTGNIPLSNFTITDTVPPQINVTEIGPTGGASISYQTNLNATFTSFPGGNLSLPIGEWVTVIRWVLPTANPEMSPPQVTIPPTGLSGYFRGTVISPDHNGDTLSPGDTVTNTADLTYDFDDSPTGPGSGSVTSDPAAEFEIAPLPLPQFSKVSQGGIAPEWRFLIDQSVGYYLLDINNITGVPLDNVMFTDHIPPQFDVTSVSSGQYYNGGGVTTTVSYQTNLSGGFVTLGTSPAGVNDTFPIPSLGAGEYVTDVRWAFGTVPIDFGTDPYGFLPPSPSDAPRINGTVIDPDNTGAAVNDNDPMTNNADLEWTYAGIDDSLSVDITDPVREPVAQPSVNKTSLTTGPFIPSQIITYQLRVGATAASPSRMFDPIVMELLPVGLSYVPGTWAFNPGSTGSPNPIFEEIADFNGTGRTLLRWRFSHTFVQGQFATITFNTLVDPTASEGALTNEYYVTTNTMPLVSGDPDVSDLDSDGDDTDLIAGSSTSVSIEQLVGLDSVKGVLGELDSDFSVFPNTGRTLPSGEITYRLRIFNQGNIDISNVRVIDILPFVGDTGVRDTSPRLTEWRPVLTSAIVPQPGVTVFYSTSSNPCRPDIVTSGPVGCTAPNWSTLPPANIATVQSLRFDFAGILNPGDTFEFIWNMQAPPDAGAGEIAWNSFAFTSTNAATGIPLRPAEPNKVGIEIEIPTISPRIDLEKATNGDDADLPTGPLVPVGSTVTWTYVITNTGNTRLDNIVLTDDMLSNPITCLEGPIPPLEVTDPPDFFTCTAVITPPDDDSAVSGQYANVGTVEGTPVDADGDPLIDPDTTLPVPPVTDDDPSHYFGYNDALARLGDFVWIDSDTDGVQDIGEPGLPGVTVNLLDGTGAFLESTTTDGNGEYAFVDLPPGDYIVEFVLPAAFYTFTQQDAGGDDALDSDADPNPASPTYGRTTIITLNAGDDDLTWDAGVLQPASIGNRVWHDVNSNGRQDAGEPGVGNITVRLYRDSDPVTPVASTLTNVDGTYVFTDLVPGDYQIEVVLPISYLFTTQNSAVATSATDSDVDPLTERAILTTLSPGEYDPDWDAGLVFPATIGNFVWHDLDADGVQDGGEPGIPNVLVTLYDSADNPVDTRLTNVNGFYNFVDIFPDDYYLVFTLPSVDYEFSPRNAGGTCVDSDADPNAGPDLGRTTTTHLDSGEIDNCWDAGMFQRASIGNYVWYDDDFDGQQDTEPFADGVTVELFTAGNVSQGTRVTAGGGLYLFDNLIPGTYYLVFSNLPANYALTVPDTGSDITDSDPAVATLRTINTTLISNEDDMTWDAGLVELATLGDYVWEDMNGNGVQDAGEPFLNGVTVELYDLGNNLIDSTTTAGGGLYLFTELYPGNYYVRFVPPVGYAITEQDSTNAANDGEDSDANPTTGNTGTINLSPGEDDRTWDAGMYRPVAIGDFVWRDFDHDGIQDGGATEAGIGGITVRLYDATNPGTPITSQTTAANGSYLFANLPPGSYFVEFVLPAVGYEFTLQNVGGDDTVDSDADFTTGRTQTVTLQSGDPDNLTLDAGLFPLASIGDRVWHDLNANGILEGGETGINGVTVTLFGGTGTQVGAPTVTAAGGLYQFTNLQPGDYYLVFTLPAGFDAFSPQDVGANDVIDSDADPTAGVNFGRTATTTLDPDEDDPTWDAGVYQYAAIGNFVWHDLNGNGRQDVGEPGIDGVTVNLYATANPSTILLTDVTSGGGIYNFVDLVPGSYFVEFVLPGGYRFTINEIGNEAGDSDAVPATGRAPSTVLTSNETDNSWDAGLYIPASIGDRVWHDLNGNGVQDGGEPGIDGVTVTLFNGAGTQVGAPIITSGGGFYLFDDLPPGNYYVDFTPPAGYTITLRDQGGDDALDSDADPTTGETIQTFLESDEDDMTWDAGLYIPASLGNYVWEDFDLDGIQDAGEAGIDGVVVNLYQASDLGTIYRTDTTSGGGAYLFDNLPPGDYVVDFILPPSYAFSPQDQGGDDTLDSDADTTAGLTTTITLVSDQDDMTWDAGMYPLVSIGDFVWDDLNANGIQDAGEPGVDGVTVTLFDGAGTQVGAPTTTAGGGLYQFTDLEPGDYYVVFSNLPAGYEFSPRNVGADITVDSDADPTAGIDYGRTATTNLEPGEDDLTWDAGIFNPASLGNFVWHDLNANGVQDAGEPGVDGVTVTLFDGAGTQVGLPTTTAGGGAYLFDNLIPGDYYVVFSNLPAGYEFSPRDQGGNDATDSDADTTAGPTFGQTIVTNLISNEDDLTWDAGIFNRASIGDFVWVDTNGNGVQDGGEVGLDGVTVTLFDGTGTQVGAPVVTSGGGAYLFDNLIPGDYQVAFTPPAGYSISPQDQGGNDATDSDANIGTGRTIITTLISNEDDMTWDAGMYIPASIGDFVWHDLNANGIQDAGEPGLAGATVFLFTSGDVLRGITTTTGTGAYAFTNLLPGDYYVLFIAPTGYVLSPQDQGGNDAADSDANTVTQRTITTNLVSGENDPTWDAGMYNPASIGNFVWDDLNANGIQDAGEPGVDGVTVTLFDGTGTQVGAPVVTSGGGAYLFDNLVPGDYYVVFSNLPAGYTFSPRDQGGNDATDSDADPTAGPTLGQTITTNLASNEDDLTWDAGIYNPASLGDFVWDDLDADGIQDAGEPGVDGVTVTLFDGAGTQVGAPVVTSGGGLYLFDNLIPGDYYVVFSNLPAGYEFSPRDQGGNDATDSDPDPTAGPTLGQTIVTTLESNEDDLTWDAGIFNRASIGNFVWVDTNGNGVQDGGEVGLDGVTVTLFNGAGTQVGVPTTTAGGGLYLFDNLIPGDYYVVFSNLPAGYTFSPQDAGADDTIDSDADPTPGPTLGQTIVTNLISNEDDLTWDAGLYIPASLGNFVWDDLNANGIQDAGELGVDGVTVTLFDGAGIQVGAPTVTAGGGLYLFDNLIPGDYYVVFSNLPAGYEFSPRNQGGNDATDSDADTTAGPTLGQTIVTNLISNEDDLTWDAGIYNPASLGNFVWDDLNANGIQDAGEPGVDGVTVTLFDGTGTQVGAPTVTAGGGLYLFDNLVPGDYYVVFSNLPAGYTFSPSDAGADDTIDSDADPTAGPTLGQTVVTNLISNEDDLTWDAGIYNPASLGNFVWDDLNADGIQDAGEPGVDGVTVTLFDGTGTQVGAPTTTAGGGLYLFDNLVPGDYYVVFSNLPAGYTFSPSDAGADDTIDSDADTTTGQTIVTNLISNEDDLTWDAGIYNPASLGNFVWDDLDADGIQDAGEPGVDGVTVTLFNGAGTQVGAPTVTAGGGLYLFDNLVPGDYYVVFSNLPAGYVFSPSDVGADDTIDSDPDPTAGPTLGQTVVTNLISNEDDLTWDAGIYNPASLGDFVWDDLNADGIQDAGEPGVDGVTVTLFDGTGTQVGAPTTTAGGGLYLFDNLVPGDYYVVFSNLPAGYTFSPRDAGADDTVDSDADTTAGPTLGRTITTNLVSNEDDLTWDAGIYNPASLGNFVWDDLNADGIQDAGEPGVDGVTVTLFDGTGTQVGAPTVTAGGGLYLFDNLVPGDYYVVFSNLPGGYVFSPQDQGADDTVDSDADTTAGPTLGQTIVTNLISNEDDLTWDAGIYNPASLGNFVWDDLNANGIQDAGEPGVDGVTVTLFNGAGTQVGAPTTTAGGGLYLFDNLVPGDYYVVFSNLPAGYTFSPRDAGADDTIDSDADTTAGPTLGRTITTNLVSNEDDLTWDAGIYNPASLGNFVWDDLNANGIQDAGEPGVDGVTVTLFDGTGTQVGAPTTTAGGGLYLFDNLVPGDYYVVFSNLPAGYTFSPIDAGADDTVDSDADTTAGPTLGQTVVTNLISNEDDLTWDAGIYNPASLGNFVWDDLNADGIQDAGEPGVDGVTVTLFDGAGTQVGAPTVTAGGGLYLFDNLVPGDYYVVFTPPAGYVFSPRDQGGNDALDSDTDPTAGPTLGQTIVTNLISNEDDLTWDAGMYIPASLGDFVWDDTNGNGIQDAGEPGVDGVTVTLFDGTGTQVGVPTTTAGGGLYQFNNLVPDDYYIVFTPPAGYTFSPRDQGGDDALDSDADTVTGRTISTTLISGENDVTWDAGMFVPASLGDYVWLDTNRDGIQDAGEPGVRNARVRLYDATDPLNLVQLATTTTDVSGFYLFDDLAPGDYLVQFVPPAGYALTLLDQGGDDALDSDANPAAGPTRGQTIITTLVSGEIDLTWDAGLYRLPVDDDDDGGTFVPASEPTPTAPDSTVLPPTRIDGVTAPVEGWTSLNTCQRVCTDWQLYHTNQTGDWEIFRLGELGDRPSISANLSQGEDAEDIAPSRSPNAEWIVFASNRDGNWEIYAAPTNGYGSQIRRITHNEVAIDTDPTWGPNNYVVFETTRNGNWDLYMIDMTTGNLRQLTTSPSNDLNAYWSPDGSKMVFQSDRSGQWQIYEMDMATMTATLLSDGLGVDVDPQYSNGGTRIAFRSYRDGSDSVIYLMDADGANVRAISDMSGDATNQSWSPDDTLIAYQSDLDGDLDVYVYEVGGGRTRQLTDNDIPDYAPAWQCNTTSLLFTSDINGNPDIFSADALPISAPGIVVDEDAEQLTIDEAADIYPLGAPVEENASREGQFPSQGLGMQTAFLNPDASLTAVDLSNESASVVWEPINSCPTVCVDWSLYHSDQTGDWDIFRLGDVNLNISQGLGDDLGPSRSPNTEWVAFTSNRDGNWEIYVADARGGNQQRVTDNAATDTDPVWSPNSQYLVYESDRGGSWNLYLFDVLTGVETQLTSGPGDNVNAAWSSAGGKLVFQSNRDGRWQIYELDLRTQVVTRLITLPDNAFDPLYATGGSLIAFRVEENGQSVLYTMQEDGDDLQAISDTDGNASNQSWYFDDTLIAYQSDLDGDLDIYVYDLITRQTRLVTANDSTDYAPTWICTQPEVVFTSDITGDANIFQTPAVPLDLPPIAVESEADQLTSGRSTDEFPVGTPSEENASRGVVTP